MLEENTKQNEEAGKVEEKMKEINDKLLDQAIAEVQLDELKTSKGTRRRKGSTISCDGLSRI